MKIIQHIVSSFYRSIKFLTLLLILFLDCSIANAQSVTNIQDLNFGTLVPYGLGGTISVLPNHSILKTGEIILKGIPTPASLDLYIDAGKTVQITYSPNIILVGDHGGTITLAPSDSSPAGNGSFVMGPSPTRITIGGTLTIGPASVTPAGSYSGQLNVDFLIIL